jgi:imidazolonepropionase-like amidohydrolase
MGRVNTNHKAATLWCTMIVVALILMCAPNVPHALAQQDAESGLVVRGGTLIDVVTGKLLPNTTIVIQGERITAVGQDGDTQVPSNAKVINAEGKYILPGLWDTHAHTRDFDGALNIHFGVTSTMDMGNLMDWILSLQEARAKQMSFGPRIFPDGMVIGGLLGPHEWAALNPEQARWAARQNIAAGVSFLKVYQEATPDMIRAVVEEAHKAGLNVTGHLRDSDAREAILAGINALAHGSGIAAATSPPDVAKRIKDGELDHELGGSVVSADYLQDPAMFDSLIELMIKHNIYMEPNLIAMFRGIYPQWPKFQLEIYRLSMNPNLAYIPNIYRRMWATDYNFHTSYPPPPELRAKLEKGYANDQLFIKKYAAAGGKFFVGTDNYYHDIAGLGVWQEMELMADAGVPPLAILQGATINPATFVHQDKNLGTVETGKLADLIILDKNPLEDIQNIRSLETVIQHGKIQDRAFSLDYRVVIPRPYLPVNSELPQPYISSIQPSAVPIGTKGLVLTINGHDFNAKNRVLWDDIDLHVLSVTPTEVRAVVPDDQLSRAGTYKVHMITGGRVHRPSLTFFQVMVTFGRKFNVRWNGQTMNSSF